MSVLVGTRRAPRLPERAPTGEVVLSCRDVRVDYGARCVLDGVALDVRSGELLALVGPNGAGKSTLVSVLSGDITPSRGEVVIDGAPLSAWSTRELAMRRSVLLQQVSVSFPFTVLQTVRMGRAPWTGIRDHEDDEAVRRSMIETDVAQFADRVYMSLSGGERARAALARVLAQQTGILLLDEPTAALDIRHQEQVLGLARRRAIAGDAVVVVMHDLGLAASHADRVVIVSGGGIRAQGPPAEVLSEDLLSDVYQCPIEVLTHPRTGSLLVLPRR